MSPRDHIKVESNCLIFSGFLCGGVWDIHLNLHINKCL